MKYIEKLVLLMKGGVIGLSMLIPGISGGNTAIIIGEYENILKAIANIFKETGKSVLYLLFLSIGAGSVFIFAAKPLSYLIFNYENEAKLFFCAFIILGIPEIYKESEIKMFSRISALKCSVQHGKITTCFSDKIHIKNIALASIAFVVFIISTFGSTDAVITDFFFYNAVTVFIFGLLLSLALVLPGISFSYVLYITGSYYVFTNAVAYINLLILVPLSCGIALGTFVFSKLLTIVLKKNRELFYLVVLSYLPISIIEIFPLAFFLANPVISVFFVSSIILTLMLLKSQ